MPTCINSEIPEHFKNNKKKCLSSVTVYDIKHNALQHLKLINNIIEK